MNYFGWALPTKLFLNDPEWLKALNLNESEEFEPTAEGWKSLFQCLTQVLHKAGLDSLVNPCFNFDHSVVNMLDNIGLIDDLLIAQKTFQDKNDYEVVVHSRFQDDQIVLGSNFIQTVENDIEMTQKVQSKFLVEHPNTSSQNTTAETIAELTSEPFLTILKNSSVTLCWENSADYQTKRRFFGSLKAMVEFRLQLEAKLKDIGEEDLIQKHIFCLDLGHLLIWRGAQEDLKQADLEIEEYLPRFAEFVKVYHIHTNDGIDDLHITPYSSEFISDPSRKGISEDKLMENSAKILEWIQIVENNSKIPKRHFTLEILNIPLSISQFITFGKHLKSSLE